MIKSTHDLAAILLIILLGFIAYANSLNNGFVYDDSLVIEDRSFLSSWNNLRYFFSPLYFTGSGEYSYRPVLTLTYFFDYLRGNGNPCAFHETNVCLHIINGLLLYCFLLYVIPFLDKRYNPRLIALFAALLFMVHPIQTESVDGSGFREEILFSIFSIASIIFFIKNKTRTNRIYLILSLISYFLALLSKESALLLIAIIFLIDVFFRKDAEAAKKDRNPPKFKYGYYAWYAAVILIYLYIRFIWMVNPGVGTSLEGVSYPGGSLYTAILTSGRIFVKYLGLLILPLKLSVEYFNYYMVYPSRSILEPKTLASLIVLFSLLIFSTRNFWKYRIFTFSVLWFFIWLVPASNILPLNHPMAERYLYISSVGFCLLSAAMIIQPFYFKPQKAISININKAQILFLVLLLSGYSILTINRNKIWREPITFWDEAMKQSPSSSRAYTNLGYAYFKKKMYNESIDAYQRAIKKNPDYADPYAGLSLAYLELGNFGKSQHYIETALRLAPDSFSNHNIQGRIFIRNQEHSKAKDEFEKSIEMDPFYAPAYNNLAMYYFKEAQYDKAIAEYKKALGFNPRSGTVYVNIGLACAAQDDLSQAREYFLQALKIDPGLVDAHNNLGVIYLRRGLYEQAKREWEQVLKIDPGHSEARKNLDALK